MNNKQSSIEWLIDNLYLKDSLKWGNIIEQAKAMHKHEIEKAHARGEVTGFGRVNHPQFYADKTPENYYNETFGGNK